MPLSLQIRSSLACATLWLADHPAVIRIALVIGPAVIGLATALLLNSPVYACPAGSGGSGGCSS